MLPAVPSFLPIYPNGIQIFMLKWYKHLSFVLGWVMNRDLSQRRWRFGHISTLMGFSQPISSDKAEWKTNQTKYFKTTCKLLSGKMDLLILSPVGTYDVWAINRMYTQCVCDTWVWLGVKNVSFWHTPHGWAAGFNGWLISRLPSLWSGLFWASAKHFQPANKDHSAHVAQ